jgi:hypothetical protein
MDPIPVPPGLRVDQIERAIVAGALGCLMLAPSNPDAPYGPLAEEEVRATCGGWRFHESDRFRSVWSVEDRRPGLVRVGFYRPPHSMQIAVEYDEQSVRPRVVGSENLKQTDEEIHTSAVLWIEQLRARIGRGLGQVAGR